MDKLDPRAFADFLEERAARKDGYIMCAVGQDPKKLSEWYFSGQYSGAQLVQARKWREKCERVWDCQGLADGYLTETLGQKINAKARDNYADWCGVKGSGVIPAKQRKRGAAVFIYGTYVHHVGYLVRPVVASKPEGDWYVVEARGVMYGVVTTRLLGRGWNRWGLMTKYFDYDAASPEEPTPEPDEPENPYPEPTILIRKGVKSVPGVKWVQWHLNRLGYDLGRWGIDGDFGAMTDAAVRAFQKAQKIEVDGVVGKITRGRFKTT